MLPRRERLRLRRTGLRLDRKLATQSGTTLHRESALLMTCSEMARTAFRGGYGIAYDQSAVSMYEQAIFNNPPFVTVNTYPTASLDAPNGGTASLNLAPPALRASPLIYQTPYVQQFSLDVEQAVTPTMTLDIGYFGDHGTHLQGVVDINEVQPGMFTKTSIGFAQQPGCSAFTSQSCEGPLNQIRPYPGYTAINAVQTIFTPTTTRCR